MDDERPSHQEDSTDSGNRPSGLLIGGFFIVVALIIAGLFLPPISLGKRLGFGGNEVAETAVSTPTESATENQTAVPGEFSLSTANQDASINVASVPAADLAAAGISTLPSTTTLQGNVYTVDADTAVNGQVAVNLSAGADARMLDLYGWDGTQWQFVASQIDATSQQIVSVDHDLYSAFALGQPNSSTPMSVAADLLPEQNLASELVPALTEISAGALTLVGNGDLQGDVVTVADGTYDRLLRVTNVGSVVDQASLAAFLNDSTAQSNQINALVNTAVSGSYSGVNLDYQGVSASQKEAFTGFVTSLNDALAAQELSLAITLDAPQETNGNWDSPGQDWVALGNIASIIYAKMPLDPAAYASNGAAEQMIGWATRQIDRTKLVIQADAGAVDRLGDAFTPLSNEDALANFGDLQFVQGAEEVEPNTAIEVVLSGNATPLEWDGTGLTYKYSYEQEGQTHHVWLGNPAALSQRLSLAKSYNVRGIAVSGLGNVTDGASYAAALSAAVGASAPPETTGAAIVWTVRDSNDSVLASESGTELTFSWEGAEEGDYTVNADFALGNTTATLGSLPIQFAAEEEVAEAEETTTEAAETEAPEEETEEPASTPTAFDPGDADAVANTNANVRLGPGLAYGIIANGAPAGTKVQLLGRSSDSNWVKVLLPSDQEGWIFATLLTLNSGVTVAGLEVAEAPPVAGGGGGNDGGSGNPSPPPPVAVPPAGNGNFELGGQAFGAPYGLMSFAGMTWIKRQHKWSPGQSGSELAGAIAEAHNGGFKILLSIPGQVYPQSLPDFGAYTEFLRSVAALPDPPDAIEIWNEMNIDAEWPLGHISASSYVNNMLAPAYNAIKSVNGNIMVISGAPAPTGFFGGCGSNGCDDGLYMADMAAAGGANYMDCIGIHYNEGIVSPNQQSGDPRGNDHYTRFFWGMVDTYYNAFGGARPLCFTELGYLSPEGYGGLPGGFAWAANVTVAQQAQWLAEAASLSANSGKVRLLIVWNIDSTTWGDDPQAGFAIIRQGGSCPACDSLRQVMGQ